MSTVAAVGPEVVASVVGYALDKLAQNSNSQILPQRIAVIGEANNANQSALTFDTKYSITSAQEAGEKFGYGSPMHQMANIFFPISGSGIGAIPVDFYPQEEADSATARIQTLTATGTATGNGTIYLVIGGRKSVNFSYYAVNIVVGDTPAVIHQKIYDAINNVLGSPVTATLDSPVTTVTCTTKWKGLTAQSINITVDTGNTNTGVTFAVAETTAGSGTPTIGNTLLAFGNIWYTKMSVGYGAVSAIIESLETFNGKPDSTSPTGRYTGILMKPLVAMIGSVLSDKDDLLTITDAEARKTNLTVALCPAAGSAGTPWEAAANFTLLNARCAQSTPHLDILGKTLPDMPLGTLGDMAQFVNRDLLVKGGCSTVDENAGLYEVKDFVTTYHPQGETPPQFRYVRNLDIDMNVYYGYHLLEQTFVKGHVICADGVDVKADKVIKPKIWKQILGAYFDALEQRGLITDAAFSKASLIVEIDGANPDRLNTEFNYKRSSYHRIGATVARAGFNTAA